MYLALLSAFLILIAGYFLSRLGYSGSPLSNEEPTVPISAVSGQVSGLSNETATGTSDWLSQVQSLVPDTGQATTSSSSSVGSTATDKLAQSIYETYLGMQQSAQTGQAGTYPTLDELTAQNKVSITAIQYDPSKFTVVADTSDTVRAYALRIASTFSTYIPSGQENELQLIEKAGGAQDPTLVAALRNRAESYRAATQDFLSMPVPQSVLTLHVQMTNTLSYIAASATAMAQLYTDPLTAIAGMKKFQESATAFAQESAALSAYFQQMSGQL